MKPTTSFTPAIPSGREAVAMLIKSRPLEIAR